MEVIDFQSLLRKYTIPQIIQRGVRPGYYINLPPMSKLPRLSVSVGSGIEDVMYVPLPLADKFHTSPAKHCLLEGPRGTGKSLAIRMDAHMRAKQWPKFNYLIIRRVMGELEQSHLIHIREEMEKLGGDFHGGKFHARYDNGSLGIFTHCENEADIGHLLSAQYGAIYFDEMTTFPWPMITRISASCRARTYDKWTAVIRGGTNPIGVSAQEVQKYYIDHNVRPEEDRYYRPQDWESIRMTMDDNPHLDKEEYIRELQHLPEHIRRAWLDGEWLVEGAYFTDFRPEKEGQPWHVVTQLPRIDGIGIFDRDQSGNLVYPWVNIYRSLDWGYSPDPCVCHWHAVLPSGHSITFKEKQWNNRLAADVAKEIEWESQGMRVVQTFADPSIYGVGKGTGSYSVGDIFDHNRVPLTKSVNDRALFGYSIHDHFNTILDGRPKHQILSPQPNGWGCPNLIRTIPLAQVDKSDPSKIASGEDHFVVSLAYFTIGQAAMSQHPQLHMTKRWLRPKGLKMYSFVKV